MSRQLFRRLLRDHRESVSLPDHQERILRLLSQCRTLDAGVHVVHCLGCGDEQIRCNSCRNRHCPLCQGAAQAAWVRAREAELLPVSYLHGVCTLPHEFLPLAERAPAVVYGLLMRCAQQALSELCADEKHLGAQVGQVAVLHTWGADLKHHPHVHLIITGGGLTPEGDWKAARITKKKGTLFLVPVACWRKRFRGLMVAGLRAAYATGVFDEADGSAPVRWPSRVDFNRFLGQVSQKSWVVYLKEPFGGPRQVVRYLGRYTHRVALSPGRLSDYDGETVTLSYRDYHRKGAQRARTFSGPAFIRAFARHILPKGFRRIRMAGLWAPRVRQRNLVRARTAIARLPSPSRRHRLRIDANRVTAAEPLPAPSRPPCRACGLIDHFVIRMAQRWSRRTGSWRNDAPRNAERLIRQRRLRAPVPQLPPGDPDPENLFDDRITACV